MTKSELSGGNNRYPEETRHRVHEHDRRANSPGSSLFTINKNVLFKLRKSKQHHGEVLLQVRARSDTKPAISRSSLERC
ncbi:hypothetical protein MASSI9I_90630 [Massilia sp. 9I]|nr:hypothetical protein MASSI9I_90630 [Massilia sp. 9I]